MPSSWSCLQQLNLRSFVDDNISKGRERSYEIIRKYNANYACY
jgi:hypothetical protein